MRNLSKTIESAERLNELHELAVATFGENWSVVYKTIIPLLLSEVKDGESVLVPAIRLAKETRMPDMRMAYLSTAYEYITRQKGGEK